MSTKQTARGGKPLIGSMRVALGLSSLSGVLITLSMPNFNIWPLGWIAFVPLLVSLYNQPFNRAYLIALPFGLIWSAAVHNWYPDVLSPIPGYGLIPAAGTFYAVMITLGSWLQGKLPTPAKLLALPATWAALEWLRFVAPVTRDWWFVLLAKSQWNFPPALQVLTVTGFPGLSFLLMLVNVALALLLIRWLRERKLQVFSIAAVGVAAGIVIAGALAIPATPAAGTFAISANTDLAFQDPELQSIERDSAEFSQAVFDVNAELTHRAATQPNNTELRPAFIVWPENKFTDADDVAVMTQLKALADDLDIYIVANVRWQTSAGRYNTALMINPEGQEVGRQAKINLFSSEEAYYTPGAKEYNVFDTPHGKVGLAVCYDRHVTYIIRGLAKNDAQIVLIPVDDDFNHNRLFPAFHATDSIFRAVENRVAVAQGTTSGISLVCDPYGRVTAMGSINKRDLATGETFTVTGQTPYTRFGDWFGILISILLGVGIVRGVILTAKNKRLL